MVKHVHYVERVQECERIFEPHRMRRYGHLSRRSRALFASVGDATLSLMLIILGMDFMAMRLHLRSVFSVFALGSSSSFFAPITTFGIWHRGNESASVTTVPRKTCVYNVLVHS